MSRRGGMLTLLDAAAQKGKSEIGHRNKVYHQIALVSPINGQVIVSNLNPGQTITTSEAMLVLSDRLIVELSSLVRYALGYVTGSAQMVYLNKNWNSAVEGVEIEYGKMRSAIPTIGRWFTLEDIRSRRKVAIIGITVVSELFGNEEPVGKTIKINRINFYVIGILCSPKVLPGTVIRAMRCLWLSPLRCTGHLV